MAKQIFNIRLEPETRAELERLGKKYDRAPAYLARKFVLEGLERAKVREKAKAIKPRQIA